MKSRALTWAVGVGVLNALLFFGVFVLGESVVALSYDQLLDLLGPLSLAFALSTWSVAPLMCGFVLGRLWPEFNLARDEFYVAVLSGAFALTLPLLVMSLWALLVMLFCAFLIGWSFRRTLFYRAEASQLG